jgi:rod shape-determining protein MreB
LAAAIGAKIPVSESFGNMIVDFGGGVTEAAVVALGGVVTHKSVRLGGYKLDEAIQCFLKKNNSLIVGERTAENIKINLGSAIKLKKIQKMEISGIDALNGLPKNMEIDSEIVYEAIRPVLDLMIVAIRESLEMTPPELVADIIDRGVVLSGGGAQLKNLNILITREIGVSAHVANDPLLCVIKGMGMVMENLDTYNRALKQYSNW